MSYKDPYMNFVMTPPIQDISVYKQYVPETSTMRVVEDSKVTGLGEVPNTPVSKSSSSFWNVSIETIAISALVISALAFMALCVVAVSNKR